MDHCDLPVVSDKGDAVYFLVNAFARRNAEDNQVGKLPILVVLILASSLLNSFLLH